MREGRAVGAVMAVRNEEATIQGALLALGRQTLAPAVVAVVDDGSTDGTADALKRIHGLPFQVRVASLPYHEGSNVGKPELARTLNAGLKLLDSYRPPIDYVIDVGSDHRLPDGYIETLVERMESDPRLVVVSGWIEGEPYTDYAPRGSGMLISADFWRRANGLRFPLIYGWESWVFLKAKQMGFESKSFKDVRSRVSRRTSLRKGVLYGRGMYALGYDRLFAIGRCLLYASKSPRAGLQMWWGYVDHRGVVRADIAGWVGAWQRRMLLRRATGIVSRRGRR